MNPVTQPTPTPPKGIREKAAERVRRLLIGRLQRGGIPTSKPERFLEIEPAEPEHYPAGWQVRVKTWRHWSDARIHVDADSGETMFRRVDRLAEPPTDGRLTQEQALKIAARLIEIPRDARLKLFAHETFAEGGYSVARLEWDHYFKDLRVDGDYLWVQIHPTTHRLVAFGRKWRQVK